MINTLWVEQYRPSNTEELIIPNRIGTIIDGYLKKNDIPSLLFYGPAGTGKTSAAKAIVKTLDAEMLFINASDDTGKADILNQVVPFATGISMHNSSVPKIIIMDECDRLSTNAQDSLKSWMETVSKNCRFIFTANTPSKIIEPIKSRCSCFDFNILTSEKPELMSKLFARITKILDEKQVKYDPAVIPHIIVKHFPDYRRLLNTLQSYSTGFGEINSGILTSSDDSIANVVFPLIKAKDFEATRKWIMETTASHDDIFNALFRSMGNHIEKGAIPQVTVIMADYQYKAAFCLNQQLNLLACMIEIMAVL